MYTVIQLCDMLLFCTGLTPWENTSNMVFYIWVPYVKTYA